MSRFDDEYYRRLQGITFSISAATKAATPTTGLAKAAEQLSNLSSAVRATVDVESMPGIIAAEREMAEFTAPMKTALAFEHANKGLLESTDQRSALVGNAVKILDRFSKIGNEINSNTATTSMIAGLSQVAVAARAAAPSGFASNLVKVIPNLAEALGNSFSGVDLEVLGRVTDTALADETFSWEDEEETTRTAQAIADAYNQEPHREVRFDSKDKEIPKRTPLTADQVFLWLERIGIIIAIIGGLLQIKDSTCNSLEKPKVIYQQQVEITNNYYTKFYGYDSRILNENKWRIVNQDIIVRVKHDCHSSVAGRIEAGTPIQIKDKYKKWRQIEWTDESGGERLGWIQNWKLQEFEE